MYPLKNFQEGVMEAVMDTLGTDKLETLFVKDAHCCQCHIRCGSIMQIKKGLMPVKPWMDRNMRRFMLLGERSEITIWK